METVKQSYVNSIDQLSKELSNMKEQYEQLSADNQLLNSQLENRSLNIDHAQEEPVKGSFSILFCICHKIKSLNIFRIFTNRFDK